MWYLVSPTTLLRTGIPVRLVAVLLCLLTVDTHLGAAHSREESARPQRQGNVRNTTPLWGGALACALCFALFLSALPTLVQRPQLLLVLVNAKRQRRNVVILRPHGPFRLPDFVAPPDTATETVIKTPNKPLAAQWQAKSSVAALCTVWHRQLPVPTSPAFITACATASRSSSTETACQSISGKTYSRRSKQC